MLSCVFALFPVTARAEAQYELIVQKGAKMTWEYNTVDNELLEDISALIDFDTTLLFTENLESGTQLTYTIDTIYDYDDYWMLYINYVINDNSDSASISEYVYDDTTLISNDSFYQIDQNQFRILPVELKEYISNFPDDLPDVVIDISENSFIIKQQDINDTRITANFEYNEDGVLETFELKCNYTSALEYELVDYTNEGEDYTGVIIAVVVVSIIIAIFIAVAVVANKKNKKSPHKSVPQKSTSNTEFKPSTPSTPSISEQMTPKSVSGPSIYDKFELNEDDFEGYIAKRKKIGYV